MLNRWDGDLWKKIPQRHNDPDVWIPVDLERRPSRANEDIFRTANLAHDLAVSDIYTALYPFRTEDGKRPLTAWDRDRETEAYRAVHYDAQFTLYGKACFLEVERGNHPIIKPDARVSKEYERKSLNHKLDAYFSYMGRFEKTPYLLITVEDWSGGFYDAHGTEGYLKDVVELIKSHKFAPYILVARHRDIVGDRDEVETEIHNDELGDAFGHSWICPAHPTDFVSLQSLTKHV